MYKKISIVDEHDNVVGSADYFEAFEKGYIRRVSRVFVFDTEGKQLLQKRSKDVHFPMLFDQAVGGHVDEGETYYEAAVREMQEEIGLVDVPLTELALSYRTDVFNGIYKAVVPVGTYIAYDTHEIDSIYWVTTEELEKTMRFDPSSFSSGYIDIWHHLRDKLVG